MFWKNVLKVLESIGVGILTLAGAILLSPFALIALLIGLPVDAISSIWGN